MLFSSIWFNCKLMENVNWLTSWMLVVWKILDVCFDLKIAVMHYGLLNHGALVKGCCMLATARRLHTSLHVAYTSRCAHAKSAHWPFSEPYMFSKRESQNHLSVRHSIATSAVKAALAKCMPFPAIRPNEALEAIGTSNFLISSDNSSEEFVASRFSQPTTGYFYFEPGSITQHPICFYFILKPWNRSEVAKSQSEVD